MGGKEEEKGVEEERERRIERRRTIREKEKKEKEVLYYPFKSMTNGIQVVVETGWDEDVG